MNDMSEINPKALVAPPMPLTDSSFYVAEKVALENGKTMTEFVAGPFETADEAREAYHQMHDEHPDKELSCVEFVRYRMEGEE